MLSPIPNPRGLTRALTRDNPPRPSVAQAMPQRRGATLRDTAAAPAGAPSEAGAAVASSAAPEPRGVSRGVAEDGVDAACHCDAARDAAPAK